MDATVAIGGAPSEDRIRSAWLSGEYAQTIDLLLCEPRSADRDLWLVQAYLRTAKHAQALTVLHDARSDGQFDCATDAARAAAFEAVAYSALGCESDAREALTHAGSYEMQTGAVRLELALNHALTAWMLGDGQHARAIVAEHLSRDAARIDPYITARFHMLRGWLSATLERYHEQAAALITAIEHLQRAPDQDVGLLAWAVYPLAALVRDIDFPRGLAIVNKFEQALPWPADLALAQFQTMRAVAWTMALNGNYITAFRKFSAANTLATRTLGHAPVMKMLAHLDHAQTARFSGQDLAAAAELAEARDLIRAHDWSTAVWEESRALIQAAELLAAEDVNAASDLLQQAKKLQPSMSRNAGYAHDRRLAAHMDYAEALVREARSDRRLARHRALRAFEVFSACGYSWQAARCAVVLGRCGEPGDWLRTAQELLQPYPRSAIAQEVNKRIDEDNPIERLTSRQRDILQDLCAGRKIDEIAHAKGIAPNTVRVHITQIHRVFGVERRSQLIREALRFIAA